MSKTSRSSSLPEPRPPTNGHISSQGFALGVLLITVLALGLRAWRLGAQSLWFDETFTVLVARKPWTEGLRILVVDGVHPPLFYWLTKLILPWGQKEAMIRLPAMVFGGLSVPLLALLARRWVGSHTALWAALLYALAPFHIWYAQEARMYTLLAFLTLTSIGAYGFWLRRPTLPRRVLFVLSHALAYFTHYFALWLPIIELLHLTLHQRRHRRRMKEWVVEQCLAAVPLLGWLFMLSRRPVAFFGIGWIPRPVWWDGLLTLVNFTAGYWEPVPIFPLMILALSGGLFLFALRAPWRDQESRSLILLWALVPILLTLIISMQQPSVYMDRYLILSQPAWLLLLARGMTALPSAKDGQQRAGTLGGVAVRLVLLITFLYGDYHLLLSPHKPQKENWRAAATYLNTHAKDNELILLRNAQIAIPFHIYPLAHHMDIWETNGAVQPFADLTSSYPGVWLVYWNAVGKSHFVLHEWVHAVSFEQAWGSDPLLQQWQQSPTFRLQARADFPGVTIFHLIRRE